MTLDPIKAHRIEDEKVETELARQRREGLSPNGCEDRTANDTSLNTRSTPADGLAGELAALIKKATPGNLQTAKIVEEGGFVECPMCSGEGEVEQDAHCCNIDGVALGVQFYGIGKQFGAHQELWAWLMANRDRILASLEAEKREALDDEWRKAAMQLAIREADYRLNHDVHGDGSNEAGRSWDLMRRAGDRVRELAGLIAAPAIADFK